MEKSYEAYVNTQNINGICVPLPIQTNFIRTYCEKNNYPLPLPCCEILFLGNYTMLKKVLRSDATDILMISNFLIPDKNFIKTLKINKKSINKRVHFILERDVVEMSKIFDYIKTNDTLNGLSKYSSNLVSSIGKSK